jgi:predicted lipoprotein
VLLGLVIAACASGPPEDAVVSSITNESLLPALDGSASAASGLAEAATTFCADPTEASHQEMLLAWEDAKGKWGEAWLTTWFGPADMLRTVSRVDYQPISADAIERLLASTETLDADYVMNQAASTERGLGAIEYLAYDAVETSADERRCELLSAAAEVVASETGALEAAWASSNEGGAAFAEEFSGEDMPSNDALGELVSSVVETLKQQSLFQLGKALGITAPEPEIEAIPEGAAGFATRFYRAQLESIRSMLDAGAPDSLGELIAARSPEVMDRIDQHLDGALQELDGLDGPMREFAEEEPDRVEPLYDHLFELLNLFESDVVSLLDVTLGFSDTDGDTG